MGAHYHQLVKPWTISPPGTFTWLMVHAVSGMIDGACSQAVELVLPTLLVDLGTEVGNHTPCYH